MTAESFSPAIPKFNNIDWLRIIFASQVMIVHAGEHLSYEVPSTINYLPGVPAFFFVSGFLIYASYINAPGIRYLQNRVLRILPALILVTLGGVVVALVAHGWRDIIEHPKAYLIWVAAQLTLGQAYNPGHFRDIGVGVINGSLWTITTEIIFYMSVPIIAKLISYSRIWLYVLMCGSFAVFVFGPNAFGFPVYGDRTFYDFLAVTPLPWGWMFGFGILTYLFFERIKPWIKYFPILIAPLAFMSAFGEGVLFASTGNRLGLIYFACLIGIVIYVAFGIKPIRLSEDLSYGVYIWHMIVVNLLIVLAVPDPGFAFSLAILGTFSVACLSWFLVEKPALRLKGKSLRSHQSVGATIAAPPPAVTGPNKT